MAFHNLQLLPSSSADVYAWPITEGTLGVFLWAFSKCSFETRAKNKRIHLFRKLHLCTVWWSLPTVLLSLAVSERTGHCKVSGTLELRQFGRWRQTQKSSKAIFKSQDQIIKKKASKFCNCPVYKCIPFSVFDQAWKILKLFADHLQTVSSSGWKI